MANNVDIIGEEAALLQLIINDFSETDGWFEDSDVLSVRGHGFRNRTKVIGVIFPNCLSVGGYAFSTCTRLSALDIIGEGTLPNYTLQSCETLTDIVLRKSDEIVKLQSGYVYSDALWSKQIKLVNVYVPNNLISSYQAASTWSTLYASNPNLFKSLENYTVDGTLTGEFNWALVDTVETPIFSVSNTELSSTAIDSGVQLFSTTTPEFTILLDFTLGSNSGMGALVCGCWNGSVGVRIGRSGATHNISLEYKRVGTNASTNKVFTWGIGTRKQIALVVKNGYMFSEVFADGEFGEQLIGSGTPSSTLTDTFKVGGTATKGTVHSLKLYNKALNYRQILKELKTMRLSV